MPDSKHRPILPPGTQILYTWWPPDSDQDPQDNMRQSVGLIDSKCPTDQAPPLYRIIVQEWTRDMLEANVLCLVAIEGPDAGQFVVNEPCEDRLTDPSQRFPEEIPSPKATGIEAILEARLAAAIDDGNDELAHHYHARLEHLANGQ